MSQSKDAGLPAASPPVSGREDRERRLVLLLEERARLLGRVRRLDQAIAALRCEAIRATEPPSGEREVVFSLRGEDAELGTFEPPPGVDAEDLRCWLTKVLLAARKGGSRIASLELLIHCQLPGGRVRSIAARQAGALGWVTQLERPPREVDSEGLA